MKAILSVDLGFGYVKAVCEYLENNQVVRKKLAFPSLVKSKTSRSSFASFMGTQDDYQVEAFGIKTDVNPGLVDQVYYVGDSAITNSGKRRWTDKGEFHTEELTVLLGTACTLLVPQEVTDLTLEIGLPMNYFQDSASDLYDHVVSIDTVIRVKDIERRVQFDKVEVKPQGVGAYFDIIFDWNGRVRNQELAESSIGIIILGYRTVEYLLAKSGKRGVQFIDDKSGSLEKEGMNSFLDMISKRIINQHKVELSLVDIERAVFFEDCLIDTKTGRLDISSIVEDVKATYTQDIVGQIKTIWGSDEEILRSVFLGGGSAKYLFDQFKDNFKNLVLHGKEAETEKREEAHIYSNANGFLKMHKIANQ